MILFAFFAQPKAYLKILKLLFQLTQWFFKRLRNRMIKNKIFLDQNLPNLSRSQYLQYLQGQLHKISTELSTDFVGNFLLLLWWKIFKNLKLLPEAYLSVTLPKKIKYFFQQPRWFFIFQNEYNPGACIFGSLHFSLASVHYHFVLNFPIYIGC